MEEMRSRFESAINRQKLRSNSCRFSRAKYDALIDDVLRVKREGCKIPRDYWLLKRYDVWELGDCKKLIFPLDRPDDDIVYYVAVDELFSVLYETHLAIGHGGRDRMFHELSKKYKNITVSDVTKFLSVCVHCQQKRGKDKRATPVVKPILSNELNSRCQVDLIDFQGRPDGEFKYVLVYQDNLTKFVQLRPLRSKRAVEVAERLYEIFTIFGAPNVLHSDNGREFRNEVVSSLTRLWPQIKLVHGKPRHSESQGSVERANQDVENMMFTWMQDNRSNKWSKGIYLIQFMKNRAFHAGIHRSPYRALFGCDPKIGLASSKIPHELIGTLETEDDLIRTINEDVSPSSSPLLPLPPPSSLQPPPPPSSPAQSRQSSTSASSSPAASMPRSPPPPSSSSSSSSSASSLPSCSSFINKIDKNDRFEFEYECVGCHQPIRAPSKKRRRTATADDDDADVEETMCSLCLKEYRITTQRTGAKSNLEKQADRMQSKCVEYYTSVETGTTVRLVVPDADRDRGEARSVLAVVLRKRDDAYKLGTRFGILQQHYMRSQFVVCKEKLLNVEDVPDEEISLRTTASRQAAAAAAAVTGAGKRVICNCTTKCTTKKCLCRRKKRLCTSKCHGSKTCKNKHQDK